MATLARRLEDLSSDKQALLTIKLEKITLNQEPKSADTQLVAYIVPALRGSGLAKVDSFARDGERSSRNRPGNGNEGLAQDDPNVNRSLSPELVRSYLRQHLPEHMLPARYVILENLPLTPNGKINYKVLSIPVQPESSVKRGFVAPSTDSEVKVANIWGDILRMEQIGIHDNFFELGGHSLLATRLLSRIRNVFHVELPLRTFFDTPTIAGLTVAILQSQAEHLENETMAEILAEIENLEE